MEGGGDHDSTLSLLNRVGGGGNDEQQLDLGLGLSLGLGGGGSTGKRTAQGSGGPLRIKRTAQGAGEGPLSLSHVKVIMDDDPIGRKVSLNAHVSYESLTAALQHMFLRYGQDKQGDWMLTYQDSDGDWMLVGDVPWGMFRSSVRRLRIMRKDRTTGANGLISTSIGSFTITSSRVE